MTAQWGKNILIPNQFVAYEALMLVKKKMLSMTRIIPEIHYNLADLVSGNDHTSCLVTYRIT